MTAAGLFLFGRSAQIWMIRRARKLVYFALAYGPREQEGTPRVRIHNQNMTVAARAMAERKTFGHLS